VEALGFEAFGVGPDWLENLDDPFMREHTRGGVPPFMEVARLGMAEDLIQVARAWTPSVIVRGASEFSGMIAAGVVGLPLAVHGIAVESLWYRFIAEPVSALRTSFGLDAGSDMSWLDGDLRLDRVPPSFQVPGIEPSPATRSIRPAIFDRVQEEADLPSWVETLGSRPVVYATLGSVFNHAPHIFEVILTALADEPLDLIITVGPGNDPERFGTQPPNVHIVSYLPQSLLLPRCDLVITHAGFNTVMAALSAGLPLYCLPMGADQPYNALRCVELGVGLSAAHGPTPNPVGPTIDPEGLDPAEIRSAVRRLLDETRWREAAERLRSEILSLPGPDEAAGLLEQLAMPQESLATRGASA
jgi:MGT family glycosyltransferase